MLHDRSFLDDPTRLLRLVRYASRLGFTVEPHTGELAAQATSDGALGTVSGARIGAELRLLALEPDPIAAMMALTERGLGSAIDPDFGLEDEALAARALALAPEDERRDRLALALAAMRVPGRRLAPLLDTTRLPAADRETILVAATAAQALASALQRASTPSEIAAAACRSAGRSWWRSPERWVRRSRPVGG